jgi:DNA-binding Lrp family transcriptional regulator
MPIGFVLINTATTKEHEIYNRLSKIPEVMELHPLFGEYDLIAKMYIDSYEDLENIIVNKIKILDGVIDTKVLTGTRM